MYAIVYLDYAFLFEMDMRFEACDLEWNPEGKLNVPRTFPLARLTYMTRAESLREVYI